jgi:hypothetical protein
MAGAAVALPVFWEVALVVACEKATLVVSRKSVQ